AGRGVLRPVSRGGAELHRPAPRPDHHSGPGTGSRGLGRRTRRRLVHRVPGGVYERAWRPFPEVERVLEKLSERGLRLGVITNGDAAQQRKKIEWTGLAGLLPHVVASSEAGAAKPSAGIFRTACAVLGVEPRSEEHTSELQSRENLVCRLLLEKK